MAFDKELRKKAILRVKELRRTGLKLREACKRTGLELGPAARTIRQWIYIDEAPWRYRKISRGKKREEHFFPLEEKEEQNFFPETPQNLPVFPANTPKIPKMPLDVDKHYQRTRRPAEHTAAWAHFAMELKTLAQKAFDLPGSWLADYGIADDITCALNKIEFFVNRAALEEFLGEQDQIRRGEPPAEPEPEPEQGEPPEPHYPTEEEWQVRKAEMEADDPELEEPEEILWEIPPGETWSSLFRKANKLPEPEQSTPDRSAKPKCRGPLLPDPDPAPDFTDEELEEIQEEAYQLSEEQGISMAEAIRTIERRRRRARLENKSETATTSPHPPNNFFSRQEEYSTPLQRRARELAKERGISLAEAAELAAEQYEEFDEE